jgi:hypothetical protein
VRNPARAGLRPVTMGSGPVDPACMRSKEAEVQLTARRLQAHHREVVGPEREALWNDLVLAQAPEVQKYARRAGRTIPIALLDPL